MLPLVFSFKYQPRVTSECVKFRHLTDFQLNQRDHGDATLTQFPDEILILPNVLIAQTSTLFFRYFVWPKGTFLLYVSVQCCFLPQVNSVSA